MRRPRQLQHRQIDRRTDRQQYRQTQSRAIYRHQRAIQNRSTQTPSHDTGGQIRGPRGSSIVRGQACGSEARRFARNAGRLRCSGLRYLLTQLESRSADGTSFCPRSLSRARISVPKSRVPVHVGQRDSTRGKSIGPKLSIYSPVSPSIQSPYPFTKATRSTSRSSRSSTRLH